MHMLEETRLATYTFEEFEVEIFATRIEKKARLQSMCQNLAERNFITFELFGQNCCKWIYYPNYFLFSSIFQRIVDLEICLLKVGLFCSAWILNPNIFGPSVTFAFWGQFWHRRPFASFFEAIVNILEEDVDNLTTIGQKMKVICCYSI